MKRIAAFACATPAVASDIPGYAAVATPEAARLVPPSDPDALAAAVVDLLNSTGLVALDLGSLAAGGAMQQLGGPLSGVELHFVRRLVRKNE